MTERRFVGKVFSRFCPSKTTNDRGKVKKFSRHQENESDDTHTAEAAFGSFPVMQ